MLTVSGDCGVHASLDNHRPARSSALLDRVDFFEFALEPHRRYVQLLLSIADCCCGDNLFVIAWRATALCCCLVL
jgi:hypothetical protein